jgi:hypothetical protein
MLDHIPQCDRVEVGRVARLPMIAFDRMLVNDEPMFSFGVLRAAVAEFDTDNIRALLFEQREK